MNEKLKWVVGTDGLGEWHISRQIEEGRCAREWDLDHGLVRQFDSEEKAERRCKQLNRYLY